MYGNNKLCQIKESGREERGAKAGIYPASTLSMAKPLGNITKSHPIHTVQGFRRIRNFALQHQAGLILGKKVEFVVVVNAKLIKIFHVVLFITEKLKKLILITFNIVGLFGFVLNVLEKSLNNVNRKLL